MKKVMVCIFVSVIFLFASCESAYYALYGVNEGLQAASDEIDRIYSDD